MNPVFFSLRHYIEESLRTKALEWHPDRHRGEEAKVMRAEEVQVEHIRLLTPRVESTLVCFDSLDV